MTGHEHHEHSHAATPATRRAAPSLFRLSVAGRLAIAAVMAGSIWSAIGWALA